MAHGIFEDTVTGDIHDLTDLAEQHGNEISVGRFGNGNLIGLGSPSDERMAGTVSRKHATISYIKGFYIRDHSTNGTKVNGTLVRTDVHFLNDSDKLWFGSYGPVIYRETEVSQ